MTLPIPGRTLLEPDNHTNVGLTLEAFGSFTITKDGAVIELDEVEMAWVARLALDALKSVRA